MTKKARLISIIVSVVFLLSILTTGGILLFGKTTNEMSNPVSADYVSGQSGTVVYSNGSFGACTIYVYYDNGCISSAYVTDPTYKVDWFLYFNWAGTFSLIPRSGYVWTGNSITGKFAWSNTDNNYTDIEQARIAAYSAANSGTTYTFNRSGNNFTVSDTIPEGRCSTTSSSEAPSQVAGVLILDDINELFAYDISASVTSGSSSTATVDKTSDTYFQATKNSATFTYTASSGYMINTITINGVSVPILYAAPTDFIAVTGAKYKCYRMDSKVIVIVTELTQHSTIVGTYREASSWNVSSNKSSIQIQYDETYRESASATTALIVAEFSRNQNIQFSIDGNAVKLVGNNSTGTVAATGGTANYAHNIYNNFIYIEFTNLPSGAHTVVLDHYVAAVNTTAVTVSMPDNSGTVTVSEDGNNKTIIAIPENNSYVNSFSIDGVTVLAEYYTATVYGAGNAQSIKYYVSDSSNMFVIEIEKLYKDANIVLNTVTATKPSYNVPPTSSGAGVTGTVVTASSGGEVRMVGFDGDETDNDTIRFIAVAYRGYDFVGWQVDGEILDGYGLSADIPYKLVQDKIVTAVFKPIQNSDTTNDVTDNNQAGDFV